MSTVFGEFAALPLVKKVGERDLLYEDEFAGPFLLRVYYRFLANDCVILTHRMEDCNADEALASAFKVLDLGEKHVDSVWGQMKLIPGLSCDFPHLDHMLTVPPAVHYVSFSKEQRQVVRKQLYCAPVNKCEFNEDETKPEYLGRRKLGFPFSKWNREPIPGVSTMVNINGGPQSKQRRPAVVRYTDLQKYVKSVAEKGGVVTVENFERERCVFESDTPGADLSVVFQRQTHVMPVDDALSFLDVLAREGAAAAEAVFAGEA